MSGAACSGGGCRQGRRPCPTPEACRIPARIDRDGYESLAMFIVTVMVAGCIVGALVISGLAWSVA